jgi:hypothetical protein
MTLESRRRLNARIAALLFFATASGHAAATLESSEHAVKAAYLLHFSTYVEWPASTFRDSDSPLVIGVLGDDELARDLANIASGRRVSGHPLVIRRVLQDEATSDLQILFIGKSLERELSELLRRFRAPGLLAVTDSEGALELGSTINFVTADERVRFDISLRTAEALELRLSARLLAVARRVVDG